MKRPRKYINKQENKAIRHFFERLSFPNFDRIHCETLPDGGKSCSIYYYYSLDNDNSLSNRVEDYEHNEIVLSEWHNPKSKPWWVGTDKANAWVRQKVWEIQAALLEKLPELQSLRIKYATFVLPLPPIHIVVPEIWDHVPISESNKIKVLRPHKRNPNAPTAIKVLGPSIADDLSERPDPETGAVFKAVAAARELTPDEIEELKSRDDFWRKIVEAELKVRHYFRFVGGSPFSDECWELVQYPGVRIIMSCVIPSGTVQYICQAQRMKAS